MEAALRIDVRSVLPALSVPTLVIHATDDLIPVQGARYLADHIPGAKLMEIAGNDHAPWIRDPDQISNAIEEFLTGTHRAQRQTQRALRTVLFTDMVGSTARAASVGDERWRMILERFDQATRGLASQFGGTVVKGQGDGFMLAFPAAGSAAACALAIQRSLNEGWAGVPVPARMGLHTGNAKAEGGDFFGRTVVVAARISSMARGGEILLSQVVQEDLNGAFSLEGPRALSLKGLDGIYTVFELI